MNLLYTDPSAILKRFIVEENSQASEEILSSFTRFAISSIGVTEILIALKKKLSAREFELATRLFEADLASYSIIAFDREIGMEAVRVSDGKNLATLDSIHIASALRFKANGISFLTFDKSQAQAAKRNGLQVLGVAI